MRIPYFFQVVSWALTGSNVRSAVWLLLLVTAAAVLLSSAYLMLTRAFTRAIMHITLVLTIALNMCVLSPVDFMLPLNEPVQQRHRDILLDHQILL